MKRTPLYEQHIRDASEIINLKGFARAMHYRGHVSEHRAVRASVGLCDVSHMGELDFEGPDALALVQKLITNDASKLAINQALYSVMCDESGMVIDDLVCFRLASDHFLWVVNVTKTADDYEWVLKHARDMDVKIRNISTDTALISLQGPESREVLQRITEADLSELRYYWFTQTTIHTGHAEAHCIVSRTGYTGEHGYEIMVTRDLAPWVWDALLKVGQPLEIVPYGVAARESLRTEAGYLLNGNDMDETTTPFEAGLDWVVKFSKDFVGKDALAEAAKSGVSRRLVGLEVDGLNTLRNGYPIYRAGKEIGRVTSGPLSSDLADRNLGLGYVAAEYAKTGTEIEIALRTKRCRGQIVSMPFCPRRVKDEPAVRTYSPYDLRFTESHVWARAEIDQDDADHSQVITLGLSDFAQCSLGDVLCITLPKVGDAIAKDGSVGWLDTYRRSSDIISPVTGKVVEINDTLLQQPWQVNSYPYACTGILKIRVESLSDYLELASFQEYAAMIRELRQYDVWTQSLRVK